MPLIAPLQVSLVFCSLFTLLLCTTLCILPFTLVALSWLLLAPIIKVDILITIIMIMTMTRRPSSSP